MTTRPKTCLVLGGGGARGLAHLGVLRTLEQAGIEIDCIVGTSVGAVVGAGYALEPDALLKSRQALAYFQSEAFAGSPFKKILLKSNNIEQNVFQNILASIKKSYVFSNLLRKSSILPGEKLRSLIEDLVPDVPFDDVKIPFAVTALDLGNGEDVLMTEGALREAVLASCSVPGFFPPVEYDGRLLADAGMIGPVSVSAAIEKFEPDVVIAVDISSYLETLDKVERGLDVLLRAESIACARLNAFEIEKADVVICPDVGETYWTDFSDLETLMKEGALATEARLDEIRDVIERGGSKEESSVGGARGRVRAFLRKVSSAGTSSSGSTSAKTRSRD